MEYPGNGANDVWSMVKRLKDTNPGPIQGKPAADSQLVPTDMSAALARKLLSLARKLALMRTVQAQDDLRSPSQNPPDPPETPDAVTSGVSLSLAPASRPAVLEYAVQAGRGWH